MELVITSDYYIFSVYDPTYGWGPIIFYGLCILFGLFLIRTVVSIFTG